MRVLLAQINPTIGDLEGNCKRIETALEEARAKEAELVVFPELAICGYPPEDLLLLSHFCQQIEACLARLAPLTRGLHVLIGTLHRCEVGERKLYNSAAVLSDGKLLGFQDKVLLPTYDVFDEGRYFEPGGEIRLWTLGGLKIGILICEDIWQHTGELAEVSYRRDPVHEVAKLKPDLLVNLSASPYRTGRVQEREGVCQAVAKSVQCPVCYCNQVGGNDSLVFDGNSVFIDAEGNVAGRAAAFQEDYYLVETNWISQVGSLPYRDEVEELFEALVLGMRDYFRKTGFSKAYLGLSGGIDSAVVAAIAVEALGKEAVTAINMPSRYSSEETIADACALAKGLGIAYHTIPIEEPYDAYLNLLTPFFKGHPPDTTEENLQARVRGAMLMAFSNKFQGLVLSTGNKSELAMGYATLYGDMCGSLNILGDVLKRHVYALADFINRAGPVIPETILTRAPTAELRMNQKDTDSLPDYAIVDEVVEDYVEKHLSAEQIAAQHSIPLSLVQELIQRIHQNEYKRRQGPLAIRATTRSFSVGRRFPVVHGYHF